MTFYFVNEKYVAYLWGAVNFDGQYVKNNIGLFSFKCFSN